MTKVIFVVIYLSHTIAINQPQKFVRYLPFGYDQNLFNLSQNSNDYIQFEITFIGTIFNGKELNNVDKIAENLYYFDSKKATYSGMNVEKGINDFTFDTRIGVLKYTDERNVQWKRAEK